MFTTVYKSNPIWPDEVWQEYINMVSMYSHALRGDLQNVRAFLKGGFQSRSSLGYVRVS